MGRRVLIVVLVLAVALFAYLGYNSYDAKRSGENGDVFSKDSSSRLKTDTPSQPETDRETGAYPQNTPSNPQTVGIEQPAIAPQSAQTTPPATDTITPNPPNGMVFSGTGKYQVYRQGNLTWRINTATGDSCVLFATDEEWKKPKVYRSGCRGR